MFWEIKRNLIKNDTTLELYLKNNLQFFMEFFINLTYVTMFPFSIASMFYWLFPFFRGIYEYLYALLTEFYENSY